VIARVAEYGQTYVVPDDERELMEMVNAKD
jgi:hypothetical protein